MSQDAVIFNFAMLPDEAFSDEIRDASRAMSVIPGLEYQLGTDSLPHVTVLQFRGLRSEAADVWSRVRLLATEPMIVHFRGLAFERWRDWDGLWLRMKHCAAIRHLQARAVAVLAGRTFENGLGDLYEPHATLGAWRSRPEMPAFSLPAPILDRPGVALTPALGLSGPQFQFARRLY